MIRSQSGYAQFILILCLVSACTAAGYTIIRTYNNAIEGQAEAIKQRDAFAVKLAESEAGKARIQAEKEGLKIKHEAEKERLVAAHERQAENQVRAERARKAANADKISETSHRDAKKYENFVREAMPRNLEALACRSDLRTSRNEKACPYTIR